MTSHATATREEWLKQRLTLLAAEKDLTRRSDAVARQRQALPWVKVEKDYRFDTAEGPASLADLFRGRSQLLVYHFMFGPEYQSGCPSCSAIADGFNGLHVHLAAHDVMLWAVSLAPLDKLLAFRGRMSWSFPWASSFGDDFNADLGVSFSETQQAEEGIVFNYAREAPFRPQHGEEGGMPSRTTPDGPSVFAAMTGTDVAAYSRQRPGMSTFVLEDGAIYHSYSTYSRGVDSLWGVYQWLDRAPKGRNETGVWMRRRDEYEHV